MKGGEPPPKPARTVPAPCAQVSADTVFDLPRRAAGYCVDPKSDVRAYGVALPSPLDDVCVELFNGECELYKSYGLEGVGTLRYIPEDGSKREISVVLSSFRHSLGAYGFYSRRVLGDDRPSQLTVKSLEIEGRGVLGVGMVVLWRGKQVIEATYVSEDETPSEIEKNGPLALVPLAQKMAASLSGSAAPDETVQFLESLGASPLGTLVFPDGILSERGTGPGHLAYFEQAPVPHRVLLAARRDEDGVKDLLRLLRRALGHDKLREREVYLLRHTLEGQKPETWYVRTQGSALLFVGPLSSAESGAPLSVKQREQATEEFQKFAVARLSEVATAYQEFARKK